jgi:molybdopterin-guanine dinucleotide biosynthesis protein B
MIPSVSIVGKSNVGKTTVVINVLVELKKRGYRVATIKHHNHMSHFDQEGKDTYEHYQAGADRVIISSPKAYGVFTKVDNELELSELIALNKDLDLVIVEGYKNTKNNKIEIVRSARSNEMICSEEEVCALITDTDIKIKKPTFHLNDYVGIVGFIENNILKRGL